MTFSRPHVQSAMLRCHRMLATGHPSYKYKCIVSAVDYVNKKSLEDKFLEPGTICIKSKSEGEDEQFLYILAGLEKESKIYYGRLTVNSVALSQICEKLYYIRSKMAISEKKSEAVRTRDYAVYNK